METYFQNDQIIFYDKRNENLLEIDLEDEK